MTSGASWNERGLSPELYQAAREAARRAGMSVEDWLKSTFGDSAGASGERSPGPLSGRLGELSQRFDRSAGNEPSAPAATSVRGARLADTVAKLNARLEQLTSGRPADNTRHAAAEPPRRDDAPPTAPDNFDLGIDQAVAEIAARQRALEEVPAAAAAAAAAPASADFASLERQLHHITAQIETLRHPSAIEDAVTALRADLAGIAHAINEAMPRRALESLQNDVHALAERIDHGHGRGADPSALDAIERGLADVHARLNAMTPAEGLAAFDARVSDLSHKMDSLASGAPDPEMLRYLEAAINELRELSAGVASAEGVASLAGDVQALSARIDHIAERTGATGLDSLAHRVNELTHALDSRVAEMGPLPQHLESLVASLTDKLNRSDGLAHDQAAFEHLERQIAGIAERIEAADQKFGDLSTIERGIQQLTLQVREAREDAAVTAERVARSIAADLAQSAPQDAAEVSALKRDLESLHVNHAESDQRTHETLEAVHDTLERLVERLAMVETGARAEPHAAHAALPREQAHPAPEVRIPEPMMIGEAPAQQPSLPAHRAAPFMQIQRVERPPIDPDLPADTPLEPGSAGRGRSPAERIAASEAALAPMKREGAEITGKANFIAAARRAAQAAANEGTVEGPRAEEHKDEETPTSLIGRFLANRRRALMVGVSALLVLYGTMQLVGMFGGSDSAEPPRMTPSRTQVPEPRKLATPAPATAPAVAPAPAATAEPTPAPALSRQSTAEPLVAPTPTASLMAPTPVQAAVQPAPPAAANPAADVTGSVKPPMNIAALAAPSASPAAPTAALPNLADKIPAAIGGPALRTAAASGNPAAEYELGIRFSEGRGVPADLELAVQWFDRAARQGLAPALYRLGSYYEKGQGVKKDLEKARQLYLQAADKGNAKAIHNLAVLYAEGIDGKPDYRTAAQWFRKASDRGIADSQYNLGILYARGIGVDQNLAESYKWFTLAAQQGDQDAGKKRDDVAGRLDQQSLVAARLAVQTWAADPPPEDAMNVKAPAGGWDRAVSAAPAKPTATARRKPTSI
jgi:localization factor PodJL